MIYFIDGYNLMFLVFQSSEELQSQREAFVQEIYNKIDFLDLKVKIFFDAQYQYGESTKSHLHKLEILFSAEGETADDFIISELQRYRHPKQVFVVTSDNNLGWRARRLNAKTISCEEFMDKIDHQYHNKLRKSKSPPKVTPINADYDYYLKEFEKRLKKDEEEN